jgi:hypothetical protein
MPLSQSTAGSVSPGSGGALVAGRYQGVHSRRVTRWVMAVCFGTIFIGDDGPITHSIGHELSGIAVTLGIIALCDVWFSRRMGLTLNERGITLHYAFHRKRVPWSRITGFEWRHWHSPRSEWIWITRDHGAPLRIPALQRPPRGDYSGRWYYINILLASSNLRSSDGREADAMQTLQDALARAEGTSPSTSLKPRGEYDARGASEHI